MSKIKDENVIMKLPTIIPELIKSQGFSVVILIFGLYWFDGQLAQQKAEAKSELESLKQEYKEEIKELKIEIKGCIEENKQMHKDHEKELRESDKERTELLKKILQKL